MTDYNEQLIKNDLININNWIKTHNWDDIQLQTNLLINSSYKNKFITNNLSNYYNSIIRLNKYLKSNEATINLILNIYDYNNNKIHKGGSFMNFVKNNASTYAKLATKNATGQVKLFANEAKKQAFQYGKELSTHATQLAQQKLQQKLLPLMQPLVQSQQPLVQPQQPLVQPQQPLQPQQPQQPLIQPFMQSQQVIPTQPLAQVVAQPQQYNLNVDNNPSPELIVKCKQLLTAGLL